MRMRIRKNCISTAIGDLWGKDDYKSRIKEGNEYWYFFADSSYVFGVTHRNWNRIRVTFIRSGCLFYVLPDTPEIKEDYCPVSCYMTSRFVLSELDPVKDLKDIMSDIDTDSARLRYCFDDEHTIVRNWPNEREVSIDEAELTERFGDSSDYYLIKMLEVRGKDEIMSFELLPDEIVSLIYDLRMPDASGMPKSEYIKLYSFVVVDGIPYSRMDGFDSERIRRYSECYMGSGLRAALPDAIIEGGCVVKNRYGYQSKTITIDKP